MDKMTSQTQEFELFPGSNTLFESVFESHREYERFREDFYETVRPELERLAEARRKSEEEAMRRWYR
jgi:cyclopropane fatty-acyl-phospholipid synthase-like methyltransferase